MRQKRWIALGLVISLTCSGGVIYANQEEAQPSMADIQQIEESLEQYTSRFIVRGGSLELPQIKERVETAFVLAQNDKQKLLQNIQLDAGISVFSEENTAELPLQVKDISIEQAAEIEVSEVPTAEEYQTVQLKEKVDPKQFVGYLAATGIDPAQVQPDYQLRLSAQSGDVENQLLDNEIIKPEETIEMIPESSTSETALSVLETESEITEISTVEKQVTVALIDTGVDITHPLLVDRTIQGYDFCHNTELVYQESLGIDQAHGTHLAGVIAQQAPEVNIMPLKCFENGTAYTSDLIRAIQFAKEHGADVVNCSWGSCEENLFLKETMEQSGLLFVCAAGNNRKDIQQVPVYPAAYGLQNTIAVASVNDDFGMSYFSNFGKYSVDIAAKGRDVLSAFPGGGSEMMSGTSVSAAMVSSAAARYIQRNDRKNGSAVKESLKRSADKVSCLTGKVESGNCLNIESLLADMEGKTLSVEPEEDFDVLGYERSPAENWTLFTAEDNVQVAIGNYQRLILKSSGTVWTISNNSPSQIPGLTNIVSIASGLHGSIAAASDGRVYQWGSDNSTPQQVVGLTGIQQVAAGYGQFLALKQDQTVWGWGYNDFGEAGGREARESSEPFFEGFQDVYTPVQIWDDTLQSLSGIIKIVGGYHSSYALKQDGTLWQWGDGPNGLTAGSCLAKQRFGQVQDIATARYKLLCLGTDQSVNLYSSNSAFGNIDATDSFPQNIAAVSGTAVVQSNGTVWTWQWDEGATTATVTQKSGISDVARISSSMGYAMAIKNDGTVWTWEDNSSPYDSTPTETTPTQIIMQNDTYQVLVDEQYGVAGNAAYHLNQAGLTELGWSEYEDKYPSDPNCRMPELGEFTAQSGKLEIRKTGATNQPADVNNTALVYAVDKTFTYRQDEWNGDPRVSVWTQNFKGDYAVEVKGAFLQNSSQAYYDLMGYDKNGHYVCVGRYRIDPGTTGNFSVYNSGLNGANTCQYPLWQNARTVRTIKTVLHSASSTFQTFVDGNTFPSETTVEGAYPTDTFNMSDWGKRANGAYLSGIRINAQKSALQNDVIAQFESVKLIEIRAEHDIVDDAIAELSIYDLTDTPNRVKEDLKDLPSTLQGAAITWTSSQPDILSNEGKLVGSVTRNTEIVMTAKITNPSDKFTKYMDFTITVIKTNGFFQQFHDTVTGTPSNGKLPGSGCLSSLEHWTFWYPGTYSGTNGETHDAQVLSRDGFLILKKISDRQTENYQECLVGTRALSDEDNYLVFYGKSELQFTAKVKGTGTFRFSPLTSAGKPLFEIMLDASNKNIGISDGNGTVQTQKVTLDPTVERNYRFVMDTNGTFTFYIDGQPIKTASGEESRTMLSLNGFDRNLSKIKIWITNVTFGNTEVGFIKDIDYTISEHYLEHETKSIQMCVTENEYFDLIADMDRVENINQKFVLHYDPAKLKPIDLVKGTSEKELSPGIYEGITIETVTDGEIIFSLQGPNIVPVMEFQAKQTGNIEISIEKAIEP